MTTSQFNAVRPTTQQGLIATKPTTLIPTKSNSEGESLFCDLQKFQQHLRNEIQSGKGSIEHLEKQQQKRQHADHRSKVVNEETRELESELFILSETLEKRVPFQDVLNEISIATQQNEDLRKNLVALKSRVEEVQKISAKSQNVLSTNKSVSEDQVHYHIHLLVIITYILELLWERKEVQVLIQCQQSEFCKDVAKQDTYKTLAEDMEMDACIDYHIVLSALENEQKIQLDIDDITKQISQLNYENMETKTQSTFSSKAVDMHQFKEMQEFLSLFPKSCNMTKNEILKEEDTIICTLEELLKQQTRDDIFQRLSHAEDEEQQKILESMLLQLDQKQTELQKVDMLEEKINNELNTLRSKIESIKNQEIEDRAIIEHLSTEISNLRRESLSLKVVFYPFFIESPSEVCNVLIQSHQSNLQNELKMLEGCLEQEANYSEVKKDLEDEFALAERLKELKMEIEQNTKGQRLLEEEKERALLFLDNLNSKLIQAFHKC